MRREEEEEEKFTCLTLFHTCLVAVLPLFHICFLLHTCTSFSLSGFNKNCSDSPIVKYKQTALTADTISFVSSEHALISINLEF